MDRGRNGGGAPGYRARTARRARRHGWRRVGSAVHHPDLGRRHAVAVTTIVYTLVTATSGIPLLVLAGALVGLVVGLQRRVTGGILGPVITHLTWSLGMLFLLPVAFDRLS